MAPDALNCGHIPSRHGSSWWAADYQRTSRYESAAVSEATQLFAVSSIRFPTSSHVIAKLTSMAVVIRLAQHLHTSVLQENSV